MASLHNAPSSKQPNRGSHGSAPKQAPKQSGRPSGGRGSAPNASTPQPHRGYTPPGKGAAPSNGKSGNRVPGH